MGIEQDNTISINKLKLSQRLLLSLRYGRTVKWITKYDVVRIDSKLYCLRIDQQRAHSQNG